VILARKGAKSRTGIISLRSKTTKARTHVDRLRAADADLKKKLTEALDQQAATAEILRIISTSPTELQSVLEVVVKSAARFCKADDVTIFELDGQDLRATAHWGPIPQVIGLRMPCVRGHVAARAILERKPVQVLDLQAEIEEFPEGSAFAKRFGHRTTLGVPMLREREAVGTIVLRRTVVDSFTDKQIALLKTFADQAVIAIENTRLLNELRQRTDDLTEALEQQTATSEVLRAISSSPSELGPVFKAMIENATRLCGAEVGTLALYDGSGLRGAAVYGHSERYADVVSRVSRSLPGTGLGEMEATRQTVQVADVAAEPAYDDIRRLNADFARVRTALYVPITKESDLIGAFLIYRHQVHPFSEKQVELVKNFAAQAVIAIENTRLLNELRESLQQQTATADVLKVISSAPGELQPVFDAMLANVTRLCEAKFASLLLHEGDQFRRVSPP